VVRKVSPCSHATATVHKSLVSSTSDRTRDRRLSAAEAAETKPGKTITVGEEPLVQDSEEWSGVHDFCTFAH
jgi:hypothetical protein